MSTITMLLVSIKEEWGTFVETIIFSICSISFGTHIFSLDIHPYFLVFFSNERRSYPSFAHPECEYADYSLPINELEYTKDAIQDILDAQKTVVQDCWSCEECGFFMEGTTKDDGTTVTLHFLEYSGTLQLAEDLSRFMDLIEADKLSLYGVSYGTNVMATFATVFPSHVDKFVIDSNMYVFIMKRDQILYETFVFFLSYANNLYLSQGSRKSVVAFCNREGCWL